MALSNEARWRLWIALTDRIIGTEVADAIDEAVANVIPSYGELYENNDPAGNLINVAVPGTYYPWVTASVGPLSGPGLVTRDGSTLVIGDDGAGMYRLQLTSTLSSSNNSTVHAAIFVNGTVTTAITGMTVVNAGDRRAGISSCLMHLNAGDAIGLRVTSTGNHVDVFHVHLIVTRLGA